MKKSLHTKKHELLFSVIFLVAFAISVETGAFKSFANWVGAKITAPLNQK